MYYVFIIHSSVSGHLGCFQVLAFVNIAAMNTGVHVSFSIMVTLVSLPLFFLLKVRSSVHGILSSKPQSLVSTFVCLCVVCLVTQSCLTLKTPWTAACQAPLSMGFSRQEYWSVLPFPSPRDLPDPEMEPGSPALQAESLPTELQGKPIPHTLCYKLPRWLHR